jgi:hypothetical protein
MISRESPEEMWTKSHSIVTLSTIKLIRIDMLLSARLCSEKLAHLTASATAKPQYNVHLLKRKLCLYVMQPLNVLKTQTGNQVSAQAATIRPHTNHKSETPYI